jgi:hypothetical protein
MRLISLPSKSWFFAATMAFLVACSASQAESITPATAQAALNPLKVAVLLDKTGSAQEKGIRQPEKTFDALIDLLFRSGGELAVGLIRDKSDNTLLRLRIEVPPPKPAEPPPEANPFKDAEKKARYQSQLAGYKDQLQKWFDSAGEQRKAFMCALTGLASQRIDSPQADFCGAVERVDLFLNESDAGWQHSTHRYLVIVIDGQYNVLKKPVVIRSNAKVIMVNGPDGLRTLTYLNPERFESLESAFRFIAAKEVKDAYGASSTGK